MDHKKKNKKTVKKLDVKKLKVPLKTGYVMVPLEKRFQVLYSFMKKNVTKKVIIFVSSCEEAQFYEGFMEYERVPIMAIHRKYTESEMKNMLSKFSNSKSAILVCSEKYANILSLANLDWLVQFDPPKDFNAYIDRLRTISSNEKSQSLFFINEEELEAIRHLIKKHVNTELIDIQWSKVNNIQTKIERLIKDKHAIYLLARLAFAAYVKAYNQHECQNIYSITNISLTKAAMNFGFTVPPFVELSTLKVEVGGKRKREEAGKPMVKKIYKPVKKFKIGSV